MGREIRRVPPDWQHPIGEDGFYRPMYEQTYESALKEWNENLQEWLDGGLEDFIQGGDFSEEADARLRADPRTAFIDWEGAPPNPDMYSPTFEPGTATAYQIYENVSEGTPLSPVLKTREEAVEWVMQPHPFWGALSREAAERFVDAGYAPSIIMTGGVIRDGVQIYETLRSVFGDDEG